MENTEPRFTPQAQQARALTNALLGLLQAHPELDPQSGLLTPMSDILSDFEIEIAVSEGLDCDNAYEGPFAPPTIKYVYEDDSPRDENAFMSALQEIPEGRSAVKRLLQSATLDIVSRSPGPDQWSIRTTDYIQAINMLFRVNIGQWVADIANDYAAEFEHKFD
jgi:hypothetical protein